MLLSIDRVLQLLAEGKSVSKIAELSACSEDDVSGVIRRARDILAKYEKPLSRKKIIIKKQEPKKPEEDSEAAALLVGAELSAVPVSSQLSIYTAAFVDGKKTGPSGIGLVIHDQDDRQVGRVSQYTGTNSEPYSTYTAIIRALKLAVYFNTLSLKIKISSETICKQIDGSISIADKKSELMINEIREIASKIKKFRIESVSRAYLDKAIHYSEKALERKEG